MKSHCFDNGDAMPMLGLGTWKSAPGEVHDAVLSALRLGYRHLDCAAVYGNEKEVGTAIAEAIADGVVARDDLWVTSKLWNDRHAPQDVAGGLEATLSDLGLDYLDLYLMHWPVALALGASFPLTAADMVSLQDLPIATTWSAMEAMVDAGKARHIGVSNFSRPKLEGLLSDCRIRPGVNQVELHPYLAQRDLLDYCDEFGVFVTAYSPLGSRDRPAGLKGKDEPVLLDDPTVAAVAEAHGATAAQVLLAWGLGRGTSVIPKSVSPARMAENLKAADLELSVEGMAALDGLDRHRRYVDGGFWAVEGSDYTVENLWDEEPV